MNTHTDRCRLLLAVVVAVCMAMAAWVPAFAAQSGHKIQFAATTPHGMIPAPPNVLQTRLLNAMRLESTARGSSTPSYNFFSSFANVENVNKVPWSEFIEASKIGPTSAATADVILNRHKSDFSQFAENDWAFANLVTTDFAVSGGNATVTLKSSQISHSGASPARSPKMHSVQKSAARGARRCTRAHSSSPRALSPKNSQGASFQPRHRVRYFHLPQHFDQLQRPGRRQQLHPRQLPLVPLTARWVATGSIPTPTPRLPNFLSAIQVPLNHPLR